MRGDELAPTEPVLAPVTTAAAAREHARAVANAHWSAAAGPPRQEDLIDLLLVVSEMVTNAIRHGGGLAGFEVTPVRGGVRVAVHDHSDVVPSVTSVTSVTYGAGAPPGGHRINGYGWPLIVELARDISIGARPSGGKTISVFVPVRAAGRPGPDGTP
ncbi:ATP-binding protein [Streptomyces sp. NPDC059894]|uniref:ATP-binding protein n=1 Tax=unclassified Streptomyces TaxID=2593676 RepID=UPI00364EA902